MGVKIRKVKLKDLTKVNEYAAKLSEMHMREMPELFTKENVSFTELQLKEIINSKDKHYMTIAENDGQVIGIHYVQFIKTPSDGKVAETNIAYFYMVYVEDEYRGTEVSTMLYQDARSHCMNKKVKGEIERIEFRVWGFNHNCLKFTQKQGVRHLYSVYEIL